MSSENENQIYLFSILKMHDTINRLNEGKDGEFIIKLEDKEDIKLSFTKDDKILLALLSKLVKDIKNDFNDQYESKLLVQLSDSKKKEEELQKVNEETKLSIDSDDNKSNTSIKSEIPKKKLGRPKKFPLL